MASPARQRGVAWAARSPSETPLYLALLSFAVALIVALASSLAGGVHWFWCGVFGFLAFAATWILGARRIARKLEPMYQQAQRQIGAGMVAPAIATLRAMLPLGKWMPLLTGQIHAQLGFLHHQSGDRAAALDSLTKAGRRAGDAKLLLASFHFHDGKKVEAFKILSESMPFNRKHVLLHNAYAWLLSREGRRADAIEVLNRLLTKQSDDASADNRLRLQNEQRMNMSPFGMMWYALGFERPPASMGQMRTAPKGFREPPKQPKRRGG